MTDFTKEEIDFTKEEIDKAVEDSYYGILPSREMESWLHVSVLLRAYSVQILNKLDKILSTLE